MNNWILSFSLLALLYFSYRLDNNCFLAPSFIITAVMFVSSIVVSINTSYWEYVISVETIGMILGSILFFIIGQFLAKRFKAKVGFHRVKRELSSYIFYVPKKRIYIAVILIGFITLLLYYRQQSSNASLVGMAGSIAGIVQANRYYVGEYASDSSAIKLILTIYKMITYAFLFIYFYNRILKGARNRGLLTLIIALIYFGCCALSTNRADIITGASFLAFLIMYLSYYKYNWRNTNRVNRKLIFRIILVAIVMVVLFRYLGTLSGKSGIYSLYDNICIYVGSSIVCFDKYITGSSNLSTSFQVTLMQSLWNMLNKLGFNIPISQDIWSHQYWNHAASNVYTSLFPLYVKFRVIGTFFLEFLFGFFSGILWYKIKKGNSNWAFVVIFASFFFCFTYYSIAERVFSQVFTLTSLIEIVVAYFLISKLEKQSISPHPNEVSKDEV